MSLKSCHRAHGPPQGWSHPNINGEVFLLFVELEREVGATGKGYLAEDEELVFVTAFIVVAKPLARTS